MTLDQDRIHLTAAIELSRRCPPSATAFSVGAIVVDERGHILAEGYSRDTDTHIHAEESALSKIHQSDTRLKGATIYTSLEPCTIRKSRPFTCTQLILAACLRRVVFAWREPDLLIQGCRGAEDLTAAGIEVIELEDLSSRVRNINQHLIQPSG